MNVKFWTIRKRSRANRPTVYEVRWTVDNRQFSRSFTTKGQAEAFRFDLQTKLKQGQSFDTSTGLPTDLTAVTCYDLAQQMLEEKWSASAAKSRQTEVDNLSYLLPLLTPSNRKVPDNLRLALRSSLGRTNPKLTPSQKDALRWLQRASLPIGKIDSLTVKHILSLASVKPDGSTYSTSIQRQRRVYLSGLFTYALEHSLILVNPVSAVKSRNSNQTPPAQLPTLTDFATASKIVADVSSERVRVFLSVILYAGLRPSEAIALHKDDLLLSSTGWGSITVKASAARSASAWTDTGSARDSRGLKHRHSGSFRVVPIPPALVRLLENYSADGYLFASKKDKFLSDSTICRHWTEARTLHGLKNEMKRVYDLRHLAATTWIEAGLPIPEVADRLGHSPDVCLRVYAHSISTHRDHYNSMIDSQLP